LTDAVTVHPASLVWPATAGLVPVQLLMPHVAPRLHLGTVRQCWALAPDSQQSERSVVQSCYSSAPGEPNRWPAHTDCCCWKGSSAHTDLGKLGSFRRLPRNAAKRTVRQTVLAAGSPRSTDKPAALLPVSLSLPHYMCHLTVRSRNSGLAWREHQQDHAHSKAVHACARHTRRLVHAHRPTCQSHRQSRWKPPSHSSRC
jgi:hypothetical protein